MRLVFISSVIATTVLRITSAVNASTLFILIPVPNVPNVPIVQFVRPLPSRTLCFIMSLPSPFPAVRFALFPYCSLSFDNPVCSRQRARWNRETDLFRGFQIDDQLKLFWLLDRQVARFGAL